MTLIQKNVDKKRVFFTPPLKLLSPVYHSLSLEWACEVNLKNKYSIGQPFHQLRLFKILEMFKKKNQNNDMTSGIPTSRVAMV